MVKSATSAVSGPVALMTWDSFVRAYVYDPAARAISQQGAEFVRNGTMSHREVASWVNAQRNALLLHVRDNLNTPLGRAYAEYQKPRTALPTLETALEGKRLRSPGACETQLLTAVIEGGGRTRASTNRLAMTFRFAGPALIGVDIVLSGYIIAQASPEDRGRVAPGQQVGGIVGGGQAGMRRRRRCRGLVQGGGCRSGLCDWRHRWRARPGIRRQSARQRGRRVPVGFRGRMGSLGVAKADRNMAKAHKLAADVDPAAPIGLEPAACFYARLSQSYGAFIVIDLEVVLREQGQAPPGIDL